MRQELDKGALEDAWKRYCDNPNFVAMSMRAFAEAIQSWEQSRPKLPEGAVEAGARAIRVIDDHGAEKTYVLTNPTAQRASKPACKPPCLYWWRRMNGCEDKKTVLILSVTGLCLLFQSSSPLGLSGILFPTLHGKMTGGGSFLCSCLQARLHGISMTPSFRNSTTYLGVMAAGGMGTLPRKSMLGSKPSPSQHAPTHRVGRSNQRGNRSSYGSSFHRRDLCVRWQGDDHQQAGCRRHCRHMGGMPSVPQENGRLRGFWL